MNYIEAKLFLEISNGIYQAAVFLHLFYFFDLITVSKSLANSATNKVCYFTPRSKSEVYISLWNKVPERGK